MLLPALLPAGVYHSGAAAPDDGMRGFQGGPAPAALWQAPLISSRYAPTLRGRPAAPAGRDSSPASWESGPATSATALAVSAQAGAPQVLSLVPPVAYQAKEPQQLGDVLRMAGRKALGGGLPGAAAMAIQASLQGRQRTAGLRAVCTSRLAVVRAAPAC